jgi:tRNA threonylcarbamoyladenosine biosynthesis protein TsaE
LALSGDLGSGKTTFVQGLAQGLGHTGRLISPTFILMRKYSRFYHVDLYRLEDNLALEIENLGLTDVWNKDMIVVVEWAEKIKDLIPPGTIWIRFEDLGGDKRRITVE